MSRRGIISNNLYVNVDIKFDDVWDDLTSEDRQQIVSDNIDLIDTNSLITELENRGFSITEGGGEE